MVAALAEVQTPENDTRRDLISLDLLHGRARELSIVDFDPWVAMPPAD
jgi:hypothetical protein